MGRFSGKRVLITGASSGIGASLARQFAREGASLALVARRLSRLEALADELRPGQGKILPLACDLSLDGQMEAVMEVVHRELGLLDIVVANAGFCVIGELEALSLDDYKRQFETNVFGVIRTIQPALADLKQTKGRIAVMSSVLGFAYLPGLSAYSMSKYALRALCETLTHELRPDGVSVTMLSPGFVESDIRQTSNEQVWHPEAVDDAPSWLIMPGAKAAKRIVRAIHRRRRHQIITIHGRLVIWLARYLPWLYGALIRFSGAKQLPVQVPTEAEQLKKSTSDPR